MLSDSVKVTQKSRESSGGASSTQAFPFLAESLERAEGRLQDPH